ncbi:hypothetical protein OHC33_009057 [Knufia fluminis]|uniref:F-box domain-containing protein n=1 Tax=Knufia fluminis TaxID=191047 RepID=A0AAN8EG03_9EURO|nr:hypothetical protein OHC33_009057 [Knufia fluminis]
MTIRKYVTDSTPMEVEEIQDAKVRNAVLRLKQLKNHDHDHQSCYYWYAHEKFNFEAAAARLQCEGPAAVSQESHKDEFDTDSTQTGVFPAEIWHIISAKLENDELISLRSTNRGLADIAAEYLVQTIRLDTSFESFARFQNIANHSLLRKGVTKITFEAGLLGNVGCIHNYSRHFDRPEHADFKPQPRSLAEKPDRADRLYARSMAKFEKEVEEKYLAYRNVFEAQQLLVEGPKDHFMRCIEDFPRLEEVALQTDGLCSHTMSRQFRDKYLTDCAVPLNRYSSHTAWQLQMILRPGIKRLTARHLSPKFFDGKDNRNLQWLQARFEHLAVLRLSFRQDLEEDAADDAASVPVRSRMLKNTCLNDVLESAVNLKTLAVDFSGTERTAASLAQITHQISFPHLEQLNLDFFEAAEDVLLRFLKAQPKLHSVSLGFIVLTAGSWASLVRDMRTDLELKGCSLWGVLEDPTGIYCTDLCDRDMWVDGDRFTLEMALDMHITDKTNNYSNTGCRDEAEFDLCWNPIHRYDDNDFRDDEDLEFEFGPVDGDEDDESDTDLSLASSTEEDADEDDESLPDLEEITTTPMSVE